MCLSDRLSQRPAEVAGSVLSNIIDRNIVPRKLNGTGGRLDRCMNDCEQRPCYRRQSIGFCGLAESAAAQLAWPILGREEQPLVQIGASVGSLDLMQTSLWQTM